MWRMVEHLRRQTSAPDEIIFATSATHPDRLVQLSHIDIAGRRVPVRTYNSSTENLNAAEIRNFAKQFAGGDIVQFFDGDDLPHPQRTHITKKCFELYPPCPALLHGYEHEESILELPLVFDPIKIVTSYWCEEKDRLTPTIATSLASGPIALRREILEQTSYRNHLRHSEDKEFLRDLWTAGYTPFVYADPLMCYLPANNYGRPKKTGELGHDLSKPYPHL